MKFRCFAILAATTIAILASVNQTFTQDKTKTLTRPDDKPADHTKKVKDLGFAAAGKLRLTWKPVSASVG
jgi:hypothetical protein